MSDNDIFCGFGIEVTFDKNDDFLKIKETLTRIGVPSKDGKRLYQSCHILHKKGRYAIVNFKEMFALDGKEHSLSNTDIMRRNAVAYLLQEWGLISIVNKQAVENRLQISEIKIIPYKEKDKWELVPKYTIGKK